MNALNVLCDQLTRDLFAISKFLLIFGVNGATMSNKLFSRYVYSIH